MTIVECTVELIGSLIQSRLLVGHVFVAETDIF